MVKCPQNIRNMLILVWILHGRFWMTICCTWVGRHGGCLSHSELLYAPLVCLKDSPFLNVFELALSISTKRNAPLCTRQCPWESFLIISWFVHNPFTRWFMSMGSPILCRLSARKRSCSKVATAASHTSELRKPLWGKETFYLLLHKLFNWFRSKGLRVSLFSLIQRLGTGGAPPLPSERTPILSWKAAWPLSGELTFHRWPVLLPWCTQLALPRHRPSLSRRWRHFMAPCATVAWKIWMYCLL